MRSFFGLFLILVGCAEAVDPASVDGDDAYFRFVGEFAERVCDEAAICDPENQLYYCELGYERADHDCQDFGHGRRFGQWHASGCLA